MAKTRHPPKQLPELLGVILSQRRDTSSCSLPVLFQGMLLVISSLETPPFPFSLLRQHGWQGCPRPWGEQERVWWRLPHCMNCLVPTGLSSPQTHIGLELLKSLPKAIQSLSWKEKWNCRTQEPEPPQSFTKTSISLFSPISCLYLFHLSTYSAHQLPCQPGLCCWRYQTSCVSEPQLPSQGSSAQPHCCLSTLFGADLPSQHTPSHTGQVQALTRGHRNTLNGSCV